MQKGYHVYLPDMRRYITFADVTFHEDVPYFSLSTTPLRASLALRRREGGEEETQEQRDGERERK